MTRSGHREALTRKLEPVVASFTGVALDVGSGGRPPLTSAWTNRVHRIRVDIEWHSNVDLFCDGMALAVADSSVDAVLMSEVLEHVRDPHGMVAEIRRVLRPGGSFAGSVPFLGQGVHGAPEDYFRYTASGLESILAGFTDVTVVPNGNGLGVAWRMVLAQTRLLLPLNPIMRQLSRHTSAIQPEGYTFTARRPFDD
jgi:SAM-dependent methyltransferase